MAIRKSEKSGRKSPASPARQRDPNLWKDLLAIASRIPPESLEKIPADLGRNADHYLDGSPKED